MQEGGTQRERGGEKGSKSEQKHVDLSKKKKKKREKKLRAKQTTSVESQQFLIYSREFVREGRTLEL